MATLPDHMFVPPLREWLPAFLAGDSVAVWPGGLGRAPRAIRKLLEAWPSVAEAPSATTLLLFAQLREPAVPATVAAMQQAEVTPTRVVEVGVPVRTGLRAFVTPWRSRQLGAEAAADRLAQWLVAGLRDAEQWVSADPTDTVVTLGRWLPRADPPM